VTKPGFKDLYDYCQTLQVRIRRADIQKKALEITGNDKVITILADLDTSVCRGMFFSKNSINHPMKNIQSKNVIVLSRHLNRCWERFVFVKELMHLFDTAPEATDSGDRLERLLTDLGPHHGRSAWSDQMLSEIDSFWMALACLCPEKNRLEFEEQRIEQRIDDYGIALQLRIPQQYVPQLFTKNYTDNLSKLLS
jgi:hypothetical protein